MNICAFHQTLDDWTWTRGSLRDAGGKAPAVYLSEYLEKIVQNPGRILYKIPSPWKWLIAGGQLTVALITSKAFLDAPSRFMIRSQISIPNDPDATPLNIQGIYR